MIKRKTIGLDLAKNSFFFVVLNEHGKRVTRKKLSRNQVLPYLVNLDLSVVAMEACSSAHYWGREIRKLGHDVQLLPPQHVKGYLRGQKNDYNDAQAIAEASQHGAIRTVAIKSIEQQDQQSILHMRRLLNVERTRLINHIRGLLSEYGIVIAQRASTVKKEVPRILEDAENELTNVFRQFLNRQYLRLLDIEKELSAYQDYIEATVKSNDTCQRLITMPGVGSIVSISLTSWMGDGYQFKRGRDASAALGLIPRQNSTGGKNVLLGISKRGDSHLRSLVVNGARAVVAHAKKKTDKLSIWINRLVEQRGFNRAVIAFANKMLRMA